MRALLLALAVSLGCGDDAAPMDASPDLSADARVDVAVDAAADAFVDGAADAPNDSAADAPADGASADADVGLDASDGAADAGADGAMDGAADGSPDAGLGDRCEGDCATTAVMANGAAMETLDLAFFGFNGDGTLYVEVYGDAEPECPSEASPSPGRTMVLGTVPVFTSTDPIVTMAVLFDFEGSLTSEPLLRSTSLTIRPVAIRAEAGAEGFLRFELSAEFEGVSASGPVYAQHCASLDG